MISSILFMPGLFGNDDDSTDSDEYAVGYGYTSDSSAGFENKVSLEEIPPHLDNEWFLKCLNISRNVFKELFRYLLPAIHSYKKPYAFDKLAATIRYLAKGTCTTDLFAGGYTAISRKEFQEMFPQTINAIHDLMCNKYISLKTQNSDEQREAESYFREHYPNLPGAALCAIGTHIEITEPADDKHLFYYKYGSYSLNALMLCDHKNRIRYVKASFCGAMHDAHLWISSDLDKNFADDYLDENTSSYVLANSMFPSKPWIITPIQNARTNSVGAIFNAQHAKAYAVAEETISLLKNRFRCLLGKPPIPHTPAECVTIIDVCCVLHNMYIACPKVKKYVK